MTDPDFLHPIPDARQRLGGIGVTSFYRLVNAGELRLVKIGRRSFVAESELNRFIREQSEKTVAA